MSASSTLTYPEAEKVAADVARGWTGLTGASEVPKLETLADLVQRIMRGADQVIAAREIEWFDMATAPTDGTPLMGEVDGAEMLIVWWMNFEAWRELHSNMTNVGELVEPRRWRALTAEEKARG